MNQLAFYCNPKKVKSRDWFPKLTGSKWVINCSQPFLQRPGEELCKIYRSRHFTPSRRRITNLFFNSDPLFSSDGNRAVSRIKENARSGLVYIALPGKKLGLNNKAVSK
jgi:hypothetical protein